MYIYGDEDNTRIGKFGIVDEVDRKPMFAYNRQSKGCDSLRVPWMCFRV
jgi:hypothetical protein